MRLRGQLEKKIESKKVELQELEAKIREANAFILGMAEALKMLPKEGVDDKNVEQTLRPGSNVALARDYLRKAGKPLHISEILKGIGIDVNKTNRISVSGSLGSYARKKVIFTHTGPKCFGLAEFDSSQIEDEPPSDFGIEKK